MSLRNKQNHRDKGVDYRKGEELSWRPSWSISLWQGCSCGMVHCLGGNANDPIWRVLASTDGISSWTTFRPQHSNPNTKPLANQLWWYDFLTPPTPLIIPHRHPVFLESLMPLKNWCSIHPRRSKSSLKHSKRFCGIFPGLKQNCIAYHSYKMSSRPDWIFEIHQLWQLGFSRVYSNFYCNCLFKPDVIKIGPLSHKLYNNIILNFQEFATILNGHTKKIWNLIESTTYIMYPKIFWLKRWRDLFINTGVTLSFDKPIHNF